MQVFQFGYAASMKWLLVAAACVGVGLLPSTARAQFHPFGWQGYGGGAQHNARASAPAQPLQTIRWSAPVDLHPQYSGNDLFIHYGSACITADNLLLLPVKTGNTDGFCVEARSGATGALHWTVNSDYSLPAHNWTPSFGPTLAPDNRLYIPGAGGTIYRVAGLNRPRPLVTQIAFYGMDAYRGDPDTFNQHVKICTPLTCDRGGNIYFGFVVDSTNGANLSSGIARVAPDGTGTWASAAAVSGDSDMKKVSYNCAPAVSLDGTLLYFAVNNQAGSGYGAGDLVAVNSTTLAAVAHVRCKDVQNGNDALIIDDSTSSPIIGPDNDVYYGVLENPLHSSKGWLLHFDKTLATAKVPGAFGWDISPSIVPVSAVQAYQGSSPYLMLCKYNNYAGAGGDGKNKIAVLDPNVSALEPRTNTQTMAEVIAVEGVTPDTDFSNVPGAVREWCINSAAVDSFTNCALVNSEDGKLYRWDFVSNSLLEAVTLTPGVGEAYTPTLVGPDGLTYAINNATLFAVGRNLQTSRLPQADATIRAGQPFSYLGLGLLPTLEVQHGLANSHEGSNPQNHAAYLRFRLTDFASTPASATLKLTLLPETAHQTLNVYGIALNNWYESFINWNNAPNLRRNDFTSEGTLLGTIVVDGTRETVGLDITAWVTSHLGQSISLQILAATPDRGKTSVYSRQVPSATPYLALTF